MVFIDIDRMEEGPFGQIAEQVWFGGIEPDYPRAIKEQVMQRIEREVKISPVVGRHTVIKLIHDGEVGSYIGAIPRVTVPEDRSAMPFVLDRE